MSTSKILVTAMLVQGLVLTKLLAFANRPLPWLAVVELAAGMLWIALLFNVVFAAGLLLVWWPLP